MGREDGSGGKGGNGFYQSSPPASARFVAKKNTNALKKYQKKLHPKRVTNAEKMRKKTGTDRGTNAQKSGTGRGTNAQKIRKKTGTDRGTNAQK